MCMKSGCRVSGEDFARSIITIKASAFIVHLRKSAFIRTQIFSESALAELCGIALPYFTTSLPERKAAGFTKLRPAFCDLTFTKKKRQIENEGLQIGNNSTVSFETFSRYYNPASSEYNFSLKMRKAKGRVVRHSAFCFFSVPGMTQS